MKPVDIFLALTVALSWGVGFVLTRLAVEEMSTAVVIMLRFAISAIPILFVPRPQVPLWALLGVSVLLAAQFLAQTYGMENGVPPGLTAVVVQSQVIFTTMLAAIVLNEKPTRIQIFGMALAFCGLLMICGTAGFDFSYHTFLVTLTAPLSFAMSNILIRRLGGVDMLQLSVWVGLAATPMVMAVVLVTEGLPNAAASIQGMSWTAALSIIGLGLFGQLLSYWVWGRLLRQYHTAQVVPYALLVPFIGAGISSVVFGESFGGLRLAGMCIVLTGLVIMMLLPNVLTRLARKPA